ncbi:MAG: hypothetical protein HC852_22875 [Acaryochloridaceae cyanobacterium RU_4_10]|nr:hypothetical protein [Acaryochloridaceae cyanobacterium RU_4_10]
MTKCEGITPCFELQASGLNRTRVANVGRHLGRVKKAIAAWIVQTSEPKVSQRRDRKGRTYYQVYDPGSNTSAAFGSEAEIRAWLEQRYYR